MFNPDTVKEKIDKCYLETFACQKNNKEANKKTSEAKLKDK